MTTGLNLKHIVEGIRPLDEKWIVKARERTRQLVMPSRALGRLHDISERLCGIQKTLKPKIDRKAVLVMAGDHGVFEEGISAYPQEVTGAMVQTFLAGGAGINAISRHIGADVRVIDMGVIPDLDPDSIDGGDRLLVHKVARGTANLAKAPAMTRGMAEKAILSGFELATDLFQKGAEILGTGDMGIGNTTPSAAIGAVITGNTPEQMVGRGTGIDDHGLIKKQEAVAKGIRVNNPDPCDGLDVLTKVGGFEIGGIAGCVLAGAFHSRPVVIDGFISTAGALIAYVLCPLVTGYIFAGHRSEEAGHGLMLKHLELDPILDLGMRLGEGTGGVLSMGVMEGAVCVFNDVFTFEQAGVGP
jgi:nicotinate-nucleotide--dimethylbenzimidazole phosphoribosyltransferase